MVPYYVHITHNVQCMRTYVYTYAGDFGITQGVKPRNEQTNSAEGNDWTTMAWMTINHMPGSVF